MKNKSISIAGAGLVGSLLGLRLLQKGYRVELYESRSDMRKQNISSGRSINLALSHRGIQALKLVGLDHEILEHAIQMEGRMIHTLDGQLHFQDYSSREGEYINSISRKTLNVILLDALEELSPSCLHFDTKLISWHPEKSSATFYNKEVGNIHSEGILIGTDGANSIARKFLMENSARIRFNYSQRFQDYAYKELTIPPDAHGNFQLKKNALHIWPRGHFMMIALPNPDATFTATLFIPFTGNDGLEGLQNDEQVITYFEKNFPDCLPLIPNLTEEFFKHATGHLYTVKCQPWHFEDKLLLMGDAAHAIIPFYGQGMNCGFEDVFEFDQLLEHEHTTQQLFDQFSNQRKINTDAIADLAEDNFIEMRDKVADPIFQAKRKLEMQLEATYPEYYSKYAMVTFRPDMSYYDAMVLGRAQDELLMKTCADKREFTDLELDTIYQELKNLKYYRT
ncbi:MAG: FAD-dependent monooxygenase [Bacteroidota bacterium]|nr:FAD-dependent monooxygenase [Bacteroidota bacterium]